MLISGATSYGRIGGRLAESKGWGDPLSCIRLSASDLSAAGKVYLAVDPCGPNVLCWVGIVFLQPDGGFHWCRQRSRGCPILFSLLFWFMNEFPFFGCWGFLGVFWNDFGLGLPGLGCFV